MKFRYTARTKSGELQTGFVEAENRGTAANVLVGHDLLVLSVEPEMGKWYDRIFGALTKVKSSDVVIFTRQFATLMDAKIPVDDALKNLVKQTKNAALRDVVSEVASDVEAGLALSQALERHRGIFSEFYTNMIRSAEITGQMSAVTGFLADYLEKEDVLFAKIRNALIYPAVVVGLLIIIAGIVIGFVFPKLIPVFEEAGAELPFFTRMILNTGNFVADWWLAILIIVGLLGTAIVDYFQSKEGKAVLDFVVLRLPVFGNLFKKLYVARFAESASVLIKGGTPVVQAIGIAGHTISSMLYREAIEEIAEAARGGQLISQAMEKHSHYFPTLVSQMVAVGESTGKLDELLGRVAKFYTREADDIAANMTELIQPLLMVVIGVATGILFAAVLLPMFSLVKSL